MINIKNDTPKGAFPPPTRATRVIYKVTSFRGNYRLPHTVWLVLNKHHFLVTSQGLAVSTGGRSLTHYSNDGKGWTRSYAKCEDITYRRLSFGDLVAGIQNQAYLHRCPTWWEQGDKRKEPRHILTMLSLCSHGQADFEEVWRCFVWIYPVLTFHEPL